jgi:cell division protein FtsA
MKIHSQTLFIEINNSEYLFSLGETNDENNFKIIYEHTALIHGIENFKITDFDLVSGGIKENIYLIEQKFNFTLKDVVLIINNFDCSFVNLTGFKKLNGSQILKENITYILNSLKSSIDKFENKKKIIHIFNSKYCLDKKVVKNLPIGLYGDFYSHELSFCLLNINDYKNLNNIFSKNNLKIKKILLKSFVEGSYISNTNLKQNSFFLLSIYKKNIKISFFQNDAFKFEQNFNFGTDLIINDISKVTSLNKDTVTEVIKNSKLTIETPSEDLVEEKLFLNENFRKIKKKLVFEIAEARIQELLALCFTKNINLSNYLKLDISIFFEIEDKTNYECFKDSYNSFLSNNNHFNIKHIERIKNKDLVDSAYRLVHYGWKKEAIPVVQFKKSLIARFFDLLFN